MKFRLFSVFIALGAPFVYGSNPDLPNSTYLGIQHISMNGSFENAAVACFSEGCGGEFGGTLGGQAGGPEAFATNFWCVDSQESFDWGDEGTADVVSLSQFGDLNQLPVRFTSYTANWKNAVTDQNNVSLTSVLQRYSMAAYLVQQYSGYNNVIAGVNHPYVSGVNNDNLVQEAIWAIMNNDSITDDAGFSSTTGLTSLIDDAANHYTQVDTRKWAIVSWGADSSGNLIAPNHQTFLVELQTCATCSNVVGVAPEPGFYAALTFGLGALIIAARRRKQMSKA